MKKLIALVLCVVAACWGCAAREDNFEPDYMPESNGCQCNILGTVVSEPKEEFAPEEQPDIDPSAIMQELERLNMMLGQKRYQ